MKTYAKHTWMMVGFSLLTAAFTAAADEAASTTKTNKTTAKTYTGMVKSVDALNRAVTVKKFGGSKRINLGDSCVFTLVDKKASGFEGVRAGQKVTLSYQDANGVLVADRLTQEAMRYKGSIKEIDAEKRTMTLAGKKFIIAENCAVVLRENKQGTLADVKAGHYVTVLHEDPDGVGTALQIAQTSETFRGSLTAIDLTEKTIKAKSGIGTKQFHVASNCSILLGGKPAEMKNLKPGDNLEFSFDNVDGVNIATRIVPTKESGETGTDDEK